MQIMPRDNAIVRFTWSTSQGKVSKLLSIVFSTMAFLVILPFTAKHVDLVDILLVLTVYVLQVKIKFRLKFFNLDGFSIFFVF